MKLRFNRRFAIGAGLAVGIAGLGIGQAMIDNAAEAQKYSTVQVPIYEVDPLWPKPLPNNWLLGSTIGVWADDKDNVWIIHRTSATLNANENGAELNPPIAECCRGAPPVLQFDPEGNLLRAWGGPGQGYEWPDSNHGITMDPQGNIWIGGNGGPDSHILKFTQDGKFLAQYGKKGVRQSGTDAKGAAQFKGGSNDDSNFGRVAKLGIDAKTNELWLADGYLNKRVAVLDAATGKMKRYWGAYGNKPDDTDLGPYNPKAPLVQQFRNPVHCAELSNDGLVYVCDRQNDRLQVFTPDGKFVKEKQYANTTLAAGSVWDLVFSKDPAQKYIIMTDGQNERVRILDRNSLEELTTFGDGGRQPGQFYGVHSIATDSKGNLFVTDTYEGKRVQKFVYKGIGAAPAGHMGVLWPKR
jgi:DNA-binding beta-propeller fold protein YncE